MSAELPLSWVSRIVASIAICVVLKIVHKDYDNRQEYMKQANNIRLPKDMIIWSSTTYASILITLLIFLLRKINPICTYIYFLYPPSVMWPLISLSFFQIARLRFCFSQSSVHNQFGYKQWVFYVLYTAGLAIFVIGIALSRVKLQIVELPHKSGCTWDPTPFLLSGVTFITLVYVIWDWSVLALYIAKIVQFKRKTQTKLRKETTTEIEIVHTDRTSTVRARSGTELVTRSMSVEQIEQSNENMHTVFQRIDDILNKMLMLTLFVEASFVIGALYSVLTGRLLEEVSPALINNNLVLTFQLIVVAYMLFLMMEHNQNEYYAFLKALRMVNFCCCCCFRSLAEHLDEQHIVLEIDVKTCTTSRTGPATPQPEKSAMTEDTVTKVEVEKSPTVHYRDPSLSDQSSLRL